MSSRNAEYRNIYFMESLFIRTGLLGKDTVFLYYSRLASLCTDPIGYFRMSVKKQIKDVDFIKIKC